MLRSSAFIGLLLALTACPQDNGKLPFVEEDAGPANFVGRACNVDAECGALRCDTIRRQCICLSDESCKPSDPFAPARFCNNYTGLCVDQISGCTSDLACGATEWCDPSTRACRPLKGFCELCANDSECGGSGDNCILDTGLNQKFCGKACMSNTDCLRGATCQEKNGVKQCWPDKTPAGQAATCRNFQGCTPDSLRTCSTSVDCGDASQRCDPAKGKCVAISQACPFGTTCDPRAKVCVADCVVDADCGDVKLRCNNRVCEAISDCQSDGECPDTKVCTKRPGATVGACTPFCQADTDCPLGQACKESGSRFSCQPGCSNNAGCPLDQRCNTTTKTCEGPVLGALRTCQATASCASCETCDGVKSECVKAKLTFPHCSSCTSPGECTGGSCVSFPDGNSYCARSCGLGQECPQGFTCTSLTTGGQACVPADRSCSGKCP